MLSHVTSWNVVCPCALGPCALTLNPTVCLHAAPCTLQRDKHQFSISLTLSCKLTDRHSAFADAPAVITCLLVSSTPALTAGLTSRQAQQTVGHSVSQAAAPHGLHARDAASELLRDHAASDAGALDRGSVVRQRPGREARRVQQGVGGGQVRARRADEAPDVSYSVAEVEARHLRRDRAARV